MVNVKLCRVPGKFYEFGLNDGATVKTAIDEAGIQGYQDAEIKIGEEIVGVDRVLEDGDTILIANKSVKGA